MEANQNSTTVSSHFNSPAKDSNLHLVNSVKFLTSMPGINRLHLTSMQNDRGLLAFAEVPQVQRPMGDVWRRHLSQRQVSKSPVIIYVYFFNG